MSTWLAVFIRNLHIAYWFITRPTTRGAKAVIFNDGKILLVRLTYYPNSWTLPGGTVDKGETPREALIRECKEEVGIVLEGPEHIGNLYIEQQYKKDTVSVFKAVVNSFAVVVDRREVAEAQWYDLGALPPMGKNGKAMLNLVLSS
ncbi:MAG TPA: NUDIX domain-containing protein [Candidatus Paceibacterota bacterium]